MGDLFHKNVPSNAIMDVVGQIIENPRHTFLFLTKRPGRMAQIFQYHNPLNPIPNLWLGVTVEGEDNEWRIDQLIRIPAAKRFISVEPMLESVYFKKYFWGSEAAGDYTMVPTNGIDWVICGGETGQKARSMSIEWARHLRDQCRDAGVAFFFKQVGDGQETPDDLMVREWPQ
jgi:protein gp37